MIHFDYFSHRTGATPIAEELPYYQAARFSGKKQAGDAYQKAQDVLWREPDCDLSVYRFILRGGTWHVLVIGDKPDDRLHVELEAILTSGTLVTLPQEVLVPFLLRRLDQIQVAPWVEHHYLEDS